MSEHTKFLPTFYEPHEYLSYLRDHHPRPKGAAMSDQTPRTDDQIGYKGSSMSFIRIEFARTLERELATCRQQLAEVERERDRLLKTEYRSNALYTTLRNEQIPESDGSGMIDEIRHVLLSRKRLRAENEKLREQLSQKGGDDLRLPSTIPAVSNAAPATSDPEQVAATPSKRTKNWTEDSSHEDGNYNCICHSCGECFVGHKRRVTCRLCASIFATEGELDALRARLTAAEAAILKGDA